MLVFLPIVSSVTCALSSALSVAFKLFNKPVFDLGSKGFHWPPITHAWYTDARKHTCDLVHLHISQYIFIYPFGGITCFSHPVNHHLYLNPEEAEGYYEPLFPPLGTCRKLWLIIPSVDTSQWFWKKINYVQCVHVTGQFRGMLVACKVKHIITSFLLTLENHSSTEGGIRCYR